MPHLTPMLTSSLVTMVADGDSESSIVSRRRMECVNVSVTQPMDNVQFSISEYISPGIYFLRDDPQFGAFIMSPPLG